MARTAWLVFVVSIAATTARAQTRIVWQPFAFDTPTAGRVTAERGWLEVPERHLHRRSARIRLPVLRLRATGPNPGPPIVFLAGGPGNSGIQRVAGGSYPLFQRLRAHGDVIAFDQRGTGAAEPDLTVAGRLDLPPAESIDSPAAMRRLVVVAATIRGEMRRRGIDLAAYNTNENADDVDALRRALGVEKVVLFGHSYGTHLALAVIKRHGAHVARAILGGVNGLDRRWRAPSDGDAWLTRVAEAMGKDAVLAESTPDFVGQVRRVLAQLERDPVIVRVNSDEVLVGKSEVQVLVTLLGGDIEFVQSLPILFTNLENRTGLQPIAAAVQQVIRQRPIGTAMTYAMHVASGVSRDHQRRIAVEAPAAVFGNAINWGIGDDVAVRTLGVPDLGETFRAPFRSTVPVLLISATLDARTSETDARDVGRQFQRAAYVLLDGASHDFFFRREPSLLLMEALSAFMLNRPVRDQRIDVPVQFRHP